MSECANLLYYSLKYSSSGGKILLLLDEAGEYADFLPLVQLDRCTVVCTRFDALQCFAPVSSRVRFNRMLLKEFACGTFDTILFRITKSKACVHYIINRCFQLLKPGQALHLAGGRTEGIKTYAEKAAALFGDEHPATITSGDCTGDRVVRIVKKSSSPATPLLPDGDYATMRQLSLGGMEYCTSPGVFGWDKIDKGSEILVSALPSLAQQRVLDLGCGYGYLSVQAARLGAAEVVATDNDARAVAACRENFAFHAIPGRIVPSDGGDVLEETFDCILCNPPFHQGFQSSHAVSEKFVNAVFRLLAPEGVCYMVCNAFLGYEAKTTPFFRLQNVCEREGFKVLRLSKG